ncbi:glycosyltransferase family 1 protein [Pseudomonas sp. Irchel s3a12]|uniref:glycosyltransferase family 4 protein n=1 Tax=Pseudomonas sp. Irchel s3a12 TaxID=2009047 RepID=UPI000BA4BA91|nr:glycosyltransferase family 1 protein [Pseudomonas sp. Irchel s3a12]
MTTWFDVTTILAWRRPAVGIIRTETECAGYALEEVSNGASIKFCSFDSMSGFNEVSAVEVAETLKRISGDHAQTTVRIPNSQPQKKALETRLKEIALRITSRLPSRVRGLLYQAFQRRRLAIVEALVSFRHFRLALSLFFKPANNKFVPAKNKTNLSIEVNPFKKGDCYISVGLDWDNKDLPYLYRLKKHVGMRVVLCCYDIIPVRLPHLCVGDVAAKFANYFSDVAWCADQILCISEYTRTDLKLLLEELGAPVPDMPVIKLGGDILQQKSPVTSVEVLSLLQKKFILFVSTIERRKNHEVLYRAYTRLINKGVKDLPLLVFVGMPGWGVNDFLKDLELDPRVKEYIKVLSNVSDSDLVSLYRNCMFTLFPSLYEGWGLPVAESLAAGKYCLASNAASIPEVGGKLLDYIDPWDILSWESELEKYISDSEALRLKEQHIKCDYRIVPWAETARSVFYNAVK